METIEEAPMQSWGWMIGDESGIVEQIEITHFPDGREINVHSILSIITHILKDCAIHHDSSSEEVSEDEAETVDEVVQHEIHKLSPKVAYLSSEVGDVHEKTVDVFNMLSNYQWEAKLTLALAAIVTNYGEYWVVAQSNNPHKELTKMMKFLRQMGEINLADHKSHFDVLHALFQSMLDVIKGIMKIKDFMLQSSSDYDYEPTISIATTITVIASYWTVRSILISAPYIHSLFANDYEPSASASKERELRIMTRKLGALLTCLQNHEKKSLEKQQCIAEEKRYREMMCAFEEDHADNMRILKLLFKSKDNNNNNNDFAPIVDCSTNQRVELGSLKKKNVVLMLSSGIDNIISKRILDNLAQIWNDMCELEGGNDECKLIWFPIVKQWDDSMQHKFEEIRSKMPFYSTSDPRCIHPTTIKFMKDKFGLKRESIQLVVIDGVGKILHHNAFHVLWMWPAMARSFMTEKPSTKLAPFPLSMELLQEYYWTSHHWSFTDLFLGIDDKTTDLVSKAKHAWIIGGDNRELVKRLKTTINNGLDKINKISPGIVYIGKSRVSWEDDDDADEKKAWLFWGRVESMLLSRLHFLRRSSGHNDENEDEAAKTLKKLLSYNKKHNPQPWLIVCYLKKDKPGEWRNECYVIEDGLDAVVSKGTWEECFKGDSSSQSHNLRSLPRMHFYTATDETLRGNMMRCPHCQSVMEKNTVLSCCHHL